MARRAYHREIPKVVEPGVDARQIASITFTN